MSMIQFSKSFISHIDTYLNSFPQRCSFLFHLWKEERRFHKLEKLHAYSANEINAISNKISQLHKQQQSMLTSRQQFLSLYSLNDSNNKAASSLNKVCSELNTSIANNEGKILKLTHRRRQLMQENILVYQRCFKRMLHTLNQQKEHLLSYSFKQEKFHQRIESLFDRCEQVYNKCTGNQSVACANVKATADNFRQSIFFTRMAINEPKRPPSRVRHHRVTELF